MGRWFGLLAVLGLTVSGCSVMHFTNGKAKGTTSVSKWHHNVALALFEVSDPADPGKMCGGKNWTQITTKDTFVTAIVGSLDNSMGGLELWDPQVVEVACE